MKEKLAALYGLQQLDSGIDALKRQFAALDSGKAEATAYETAKAAHDVSEKAAHEANAEQRDAELERKSVETKRGEVENKLYSGKVNIPKELQAMQEEVEALGRRREWLDEKLVGLTEAADTRRSEEAEAKSQMNETVVAYKIKYTAYKKTAETMRAQAQLLQTQRAVAAKQIDASLLKRYEILRAGKNGVAIAPIMDGNACGGCKMGLPSSLVSAVQEGRSIVLCDNCGRILCDVK